MPLVPRWNTRLRRMRRWLSRNEWDVRLLGLPRSEGTSTAPGLVMIQLDGLAHKQVMKAIQAGRMPFLKRLMDKEGYRIHDFYSGQPATTPAVQGELFFGQKRAVPSFDFYDRKIGQIRRMFSQEPANEVEERLKSAGEKPLLAGGSAYCNIYSGGADEVHFCAVNAGLPAKRRAVNPLRRLLFASWHFMSVIRTAFLIGVELVIATGDFIRGLTRGQEFSPEFRSIFSRVIVSVMLREVATIGAQIDVARGLPIIHVNYLGYDEQAHRRGPSSKFAHWALRSLDKSIKQIWSAAHRSDHRDYDVWIYSDHGQEHTRPYQHERSESVFDAIKRVVQKHTGKPASKGVRDRRRPNRSMWLGGWSAKWLTKLLMPEDEVEPADSDAEPQSITAAGPVGHIYFHSSLTEAQSEQIAKALVEDAGIPWVMLRQPDRTARTFTPAGEFELPRQAKEILGEDHPFLEEVARDLVDICFHPDAGEIVFGGYRRNERPISFPLENGAHAGPGPDETHAFALLPADAPLPKRDRPYLRALDLRAAVLHHLGREPLEDARRVRRRPATPETISIMTYNVHSCVGLDGKLSPSRIARVIEQCGADVIALQELDVGRARSGEVDQAHTISRLVGMEHHFHPALKVEEELYGDAVLTHFPMRLVHSGALPGLAHRPLLEPRGAVWVEIDVNGQKIHLINTHLGLAPFERLAQIEELLSPRWLGHPDCQGHVILCGDLNASPRSRAYRLLTQHLKDTQCSLPGYRPSATFLSNLPFNRIDHIFVSPGIRVREISVPRTNLTRVASDHLPIVVTITLEPIENTDQRERQTGMFNLQSAVAK